MTQWPRTGCEKKPGAQSCITPVSQRSCAFFPSDLEAVLWISFNVAFKISQLPWYFNCLLFCHAKIKSCPMPFPVLGSLCESPWVPQSTGFSKAANKILCLLIFVIRCWGRHGLNTKTPTGSTWFPCLRVSISLLSLVQYVQHRCRKIKHLYFATASPSSSKIPWKPSTWPKSQVFQPHFYFWMFHVYDICDIAALFIFSRPLECPVLHKTISAWWARWVLKSA